MARAKHTVRADARRRWRQTQAGEPGDSETTTPAPAAAARPAPAPSERPSITAAFRNAYRRANVREDIAALPRLLRSRAFLISLALVVGGTVAYAVAPENFVAGLFYQAMVLPPAMAPVFVVGFFAPRASYLLGLIVAIVDVVAYAVIVYYVAPIDPADQQQLVLSALYIGPVSGIFFAAAAAWYRRFLTLSNAGAQQRARARQQQKPRAGRPSR